jgi:hypothetical protein
VDVGELDDRLGRGPLGLADLVRVLGLVGLRSRLARRGRGLDAEVEAAAAAELGDAAALVSTLAPAAAGLTDAPDVTEVHPASAAPRVRPTAATAHTTGGR